MKKHDYRFRKARAALVNGLISAAEQAHGSVSILDVGGTRDYWEQLPELWQNRPVRITIVNLNAEEYSDEHFTISAGNACSLPQYENQSFDVVHSNSVIEHVGSWSAMAAKAQEIRRIGKSLYVQTPNRHFPFEPHYKLPLVHWCPEELRARILLNVNGQLPKNSDIDIAMRRVQSIYLLSMRQMSALFPDCQLKRERFFGLTKSLIAMKTSSSI